MDTLELKRSVGQIIDSQRSQLRELALKIHAQPEIAFEEEKAANWLTQYLGDNGFRIERGVGTLPTAFKAAYGHGKPIIGLLGEYDALPGIGHGCGHNLIGVIAAGAGVAAKLAVNQFGGAVQVIGCPAEEVWAGKSIMADGASFDDLSVAMLVHPWTEDMVETSDVSTGALAAWSLEVEFLGRASHAAVEPENGINALDAMLLSFAAINALRQQIESTARIHGIITDGGQAVNAIPDHTAASLLVRAATDDYLEQLKEKVLNCFISAGIATGARCEHKWGKGHYATVMNNRHLARLFRTNMQAVGRKVRPSMPKTGASTDIGNVSQLVPTVGAMVAIAPQGTHLHSLEMAKAAGSEAAIEGLIDSAKAMAFTTVDLLAEPETMHQIGREFQKNSRGRRRRQQVGNR